MDFSGSWEIHGACALSPRSLLQRVQGRFEFRYAQHHARDSPGFMTIDSEVAAIRGFETPPLIESQLQ
jgi:hypothetical protein